MHKKIVAYRLLMSQNNNKKKEEKSEDQTVPETQMVSPVFRDGRWVEPSSSDDSSTGESIPELSGM